MGPNSIVEKSDGFGFSKILIKTSKTFFRVALRRKERVVQHMTFERGLRFSTNGTSDARLPGPFPGVGPGCPRGERVQTTCRERYDVLAILVFT